MHARRLKFSPFIILILTAFLRLYQLASVPFGWHPDEATKALMARDVLAGKYLPVFFSAFTGREALYVYLQTLFVALLGEGIFIGRLLSAFIGILTVALTYITSKELFNRRIGLLAAGFMAVSLWHLIASRNGYRAVIQPLVQLPAIYLLFRGLSAPQRTQTCSERSRSRVQRDSTSSVKWLYFIGAGIFLGLTQYTYTAVRLFPFLIITIVLLALIFDFQNTRQHIPQLAVTALVAFVVFLPLGIYFWQNPAAFFGRAAQISVFSPEWAGGDPGARLWQSIKETGRMWTVWGDINFRFNISGEPVFGLLDGLLFYAGILLSLWRAWRCRGLTREAYLTLPLWTVIMLLPMILSAESLPYYQRAIGVLPAIYIFPAIALDVGLKALENHTKERRHVLHLATIVVILLFGWLTMRTSNAYFNTWHQSPRNDDDRRVAMVYVAEFLQTAEFLQSADVNGDLYLSTQYMQHPTLALLAPEIYDGIHWFDARQSLPLPPPGTATTYILLSENKPQPTLLAAIDNLEQVDTGLDRFGRSVFNIYTLNSAVAPTPTDQSSAAWSWATSFEPGDPQGLINSIELPVNFGDVLLFEGHDRTTVVDPTAVFSPGDTLALTLYWQLLQKPDRQYTFFAHLLDASGQVVAGYDANDYPTSFWNEEGGETLLSYMPLWIPPETPPGEYQVEIGVYNQASGERVQILEGVGGETAVADRLLLTPIMVE